MSTEAPRQKSMGRDSARTSLSRLQAVIGILLLLSAGSGFYLLATDASLWLLAVSHAVGLIVIVAVDIVLGLMSLASSRRVYLPSLAAAVLAVALQLGDILTAPQYNQSISNFASYLFGLAAFDLLLGLQFAVIGVGVIGRPYASYLASRKSRRGRELDYTHRGFLKSFGLFGGLVAAAAVLTSVKLPSFSGGTPPTTTATTQLGAPSGSIANKASLRVGSPVYFDYPSGYPNALFLMSDGTLSAVSLYCTHICCVCDYDPTAKEIYCPCHGSVFNQSGGVIQGPASTPLPKITLRTDSGGYIFPTGVSNPGPCQV